MGARRMSQPPLELINEHIEIARFGRTHAIDEGTQRWYAGAEFALVGLYQELTTQEDTGT